MKKYFILLLLILSMLLTACSNGGVTPIAQPTAVSPTQPPAQPTAAPTAEQAIQPTSAPNADPAVLTANPWKWVGFTDPTQQFGVENPEKYTLIFQEDGTVNIKADCNNASGSYTADENSLKIEVGPMTKAACPPGSLSDQFIQHLGYSAIYFFKDGHLFIDLFADGGTLEFAPAEEVLHKETGMRTI